MAKNTTTRWDALSMRDRASLIKLYSQSGIRKLDDMRAHYNRFDTGGDKTNDALAKAIIDRVNQEEAAKARVEGSTMMGEKPLESEDYLFGLAAIGAKAPITGTISAVKETAPYWGKAGLRMLRDLPAFEFVDRLPTVFGGKRMTELGGDATQAAYEAITGNHNLSSMSRALVRLPGEFMIGAVPGVAGDVLMQKSARLATRGLNALSGSDGRIFNSQIVRNPENFYRSVDKEAILDAKNSGLIRGSFPDSDFPGSPYFARSQEPFSWRKYVIEGNRDSADKWISASSYNNGEIRELPAKPPYDFSGSYEGVPREISSADYSNFINEYEAFPMTGGSVNGSKAHNFVYWQKHPLLGWRKHSFTNQKPSSSNEHIIDNLTDSFPITSEELDSGLINDVARTEQNLGHPGAPSEITANESLSLPASVANVARQSAAPYVIEDLGGGYMLKSLMRGNPLEKQLSKQGTVNVNNVRALINKGSKVEQAVVDKVLASDEFAGKKAIDYNKFRKAVQDELITYNRAPDKRWADYGIERIGIDLREPEKTGFQSAFEEKQYYDWLRSRRINYDPDFDSGGADYVGADGRRYYEQDLIRDFFDTHPRRDGDMIGLNTFTFSSPRIPHGNSKHYDANTLGHSRTYTTADEPDILHVMESQSDWAQARDGVYRRLRNRQNENAVNQITEREEIISHHNKKIEELENLISKDNKILESGISEGGYPLNDWDKTYYRKEIKRAEEDIAFYKNEAENEAEYITRAKNAGYEALTEDYLTDNYITRQIQENLRYAAERGQTKMRYPTRETAAKIEGYQAKEMYVDEQGLKHDTPYEYDPEIKSKLDATQKRFDEISRSTNESDMPEYERLAKELSELSDAYTNSAVPIKNAKKVISYTNEHEGILRKYDAFPKQYKKLYKNADVRTVTDPKGNTWYEVDVPEDYLHQEWQYANGGSIHINPKNRGKFNALLKRTGKSASWFKEHGTPLQRKRATFALNARKWKHPDGGEINVLGNPSYNKAQEEYMYRYLKDSGMDDTHVAAIMGNIAVESGLNADKKQIKGPAWGLIQAEGSRQEAIKNYNDVPYLFGSKLSPEEQRQLDYIIEKGIRTYTPGEWGMAGFKGARQARKGFINETDLTKATDIFMRNYERPSKQHRSWRQNMSKYYYDKYKEPEYYVPLDFFNK